MSDGERLTEAPDPVVALSHLKEVVESLGGEGVTPCDTLVTVSRDIAPYNGPAFAVAVGLLRAELGCKIPKRILEYSGLQLPVSYDMPFFFHESRVWYYKCRVGS